MVLGSYIVQLTWKIAGNEVSQLFLASVWSFVLFCCVVQVELSGLYYALLYRSSSSCSVHQTHTYISLPHTPYTPNTYKPTPTIYPMHTKHIPTFAPPPLYTKHIPTYPYHIPPIHQTRTNLPLPYTPCTLNTYLHSPPPPIHQTHTPPHTPYIYQTHTHISPPHTLYTPNTYPHHIPLCNYSPVQVRVLYTVS